MIQSFPYLVDVTPTANTWDDVHYKDKPLYIGRKSLFTVPSTGARFYDEEGVYSVEPKHVKELLCMVTQLVITHPADVPHSIVDHDMKYCYDQSQMFNRHNTRDINKGNEVTTPNKNFIQWFFSVVSLNLYVNNWGPVYETPGKWKVMASSDEKKLRHNQKALIRFLRMHKSSAADIWFPDGHRSLTTNVDSIITKRRYYVNRLQLYPNYKFHEARVTIPSLWWHQAFMLGSVVYEASVHVWNKDHDNRFVKTQSFDSLDDKGPIRIWKGKQASYLPSESDSTSESDDEEDHANSDGNGDDDVGSLG